MIQLRGTIIRALGGFYDVWSEDGKVYRCSARGRFKKEGVTIVVGDYTDFTPLTETEGVLEGILPRRTHLNRPQVANVDHLVVVCSPQEPPLSFQLLDRLLVMAESEGLHALICMNKQDLSEGNELSHLQAVYGKASYPVLGTSALRRQGIEELEEYFRDRITVLAGPSGVGKSSLLNCIQDDLALRTGEISDRLGRGRHTTRHVELIPLKTGGLVADTPGFSQLNIEGITAAALAGCFPEFDEFLGHCRFNGCMHRHEPGCAIKEALKSGEVNTERYQNYLIFLGEIDATERSF